MCSRRSPQMNFRTIVGKDLSLPIRLLILKEMRKIHHQKTASDLELNLVVYPA